MFDLLCRAHGIEHRLTNAVVGLWRGAGRRRAAARLCRGAGAPAGAGAICPVAEGGRTLAALVPGVVTAGLVLAIRLKLSRSISCGILPPMARLSRRSSTGPKACVLEGRPGGDGTRRPSRGKHITTAGWAGEATRPQEDRSAGDGTVKATNALNACHVSNLLLNNGRAPYCGSRPHYTVAVGSMAGGGARYTDLGFCFSASSSSFQHSASAPVEKCPRRGTPTQE
jgi:hypothetical protein